MMQQKKYAWLPEAVEDMITFCRLNGLGRSREILLEAHRVMVCEIVLEERLQELDASKKDPE